MASGTVLLDPHVCEIHTIYPRPQKVCYHRPMSVAIDSERGSLRIFEASG